MIDSYELPPLALAFETGCGEPHFFSSGSVIVLKYPMISDGGAMLAAIILISFQRSDRRDRWV